MRSWMDEVSTELLHYGVPKMKWGVRRYQNLDGSLTEAGRRRYGGSDRKFGKKAVKDQKDRIKKYSRSGRFPKGSDERDTFNRETAAAIDEYTRIALARMPEKHRTNLVKNAKEQAEAEAEIEKIVEKMRARDEKRGDHSAEIYTDAKRSLASQQNLRATDKEYKAYTEAFGRASNAYANKTKTAKEYTKSAHFDRHAKRLIGNYLSSESVPRLSDEVRGMTLDEYLNRFSKKGA